VKVLVECLYCGKEFYACMSRIKRGGGKYCSISCSTTHRNLTNNPSHRPEVRAKISINHADVKGVKNPMYGRIGKNAPSYIDGRKKLGGGYRGKALANNCCICSLCGETNIKKLDIHHKDKNRKNNKLSNLQIVCSRCHYTKIHIILRDSKGRIKGRAC